MQPRIVVVEPKAAPCLRESVATGRMVTVEGPVSAMGRLDCKLASTLAVPVLARHADTFVTVTEDEARGGVEWAAGQGVDTTPSGAAGIAAALRDGGEGALCLVTEGPEA